MAVLGGGCRAVVEEAAEPLLELARRADVVFVGRDEAEALWRVRDAQGVEALLPSVPSVVVKDGAVDATLIGQKGTITVPALSVAVVEPVGSR